MMFDRAEVKNQLQFGAPDMHKSSLTMPHFIELSVPSKANERSCVFVLGVSILPLPQQRID